MGFAIRMAWRELRSNWPRMLVLIACISAGTGGLATAQLFQGSLEAAIGSQVRTLLAADIALRSDFPFTPAERAAVERLAENGARWVESRSFVAMASTIAATEASTMSSAMSSAMSSTGASAMSSTGASTGKGDAPASNAATSPAAPLDGSPSPKALPIARLVSVRAVGSLYPFYGKVETGSARPFSESLEPGTALVDPALLLFLHLEVGDSFRLGRITLRIADTLLREPDRPVSWISVGPRVLISLQDGQKSGLVGNRSRANYRLLVQLPAGSSPQLAVQALREALPQRQSRIQSYEEAQPAVSHFFSRLSLYLVLGGLIALLLGGIGVAGAVHVFMEQKREDQAVLKCLGASNAQWFACFLLLVGALGIVGSLCGLLVGLSSQGVLIRWIGDLLPVQLGWQGMFYAGIETFAFGLLSVLWFSLPSLWSVRNTPAGRVLRRVDASGEYPARLPLLPAALRGIWFAAPLLAFTLWYAGFSATAWIFITALAGALAVLYLIAQGLIALARFVARRGGFAWRQAAAGLGRPGNRTLAVILSLGLGVQVLFGMYLLQYNLLRAIYITESDETPNLYFLNIQRSEALRFTEVLRTAGFSLPELIPLILGRIQALNGAPIRMDEVENDHEKRYLFFDYALTFRGALEKGETLRSGYFAKQEELPGAQVSLSEWFAKESGLGLGDTVTMEIQGVFLESTITSVRNVDWRNRRTNFTFVYLPGALEDAPYYYVTGLRVEDARERVRLQSVLASTLPDISVLDAQAVIVVVERILDRIALVVRLMAIFTLAVGVMILLSAAVTTRFARQRELALYRTLGAERKQLVSLLAIEYALLGGMASVAGLLGGTALAWGIVHWVLELSWHTAPFSVYAFSAIATTFCTACAGLLASVDLFQRPPLAVLRSE